MAVVQISRIQIRRGKANTGTGIPQLASGEMAWAVDTQELYIGSGSVSEGAPAVNNIKVITELDLNVNGNILNLLQYIYKAADPGMQTGSSPNIPIQRPIQDRLDDRVNVVDFGANGLGAATDDTAALQRAIDQLFLNTTRSKASSDTPDGTRNRVTLEMPAGIYNLQSTLYIPSYASLVGAGPGKSIINFTGTGAAIKFVNDDSLPGVPDDVSNTLGNTQPRNILIKDLSIWTNDETQLALQLDVVKDSLFENLEIKGNWNETPNQSNRAIELNVRSGIVTCENNIFKNISIEGYTYAVYSNQDILNNTFEDCRFDDCQFGFWLGNINVSNIVGQQFGPRKTVIANCFFNNIKRHAVFVGVGTKNTIKNIKMTNVGNDGGGNAQAIYPQIYITSYGNNVIEIDSDRADDLAAEVALPYVPEVSGHGTYKSYGLRSIIVSAWEQYGTGFRLPLATAADGAPTGNISYDIDYIYRSINNFSRRGQIKVIVDVNASGSLGIPIVQLTDDYEFAGSDSNEVAALALDFRARLLLADGTEYTGALGTVPTTLAIQYANETDSGELLYSYTSTF